MNDTSIIMILGLLATLITIITPIIKLNGSIAKLSATLDNLNKKQSDDHFNLSSRVTAHGRKIDLIAEKVAAIENEVKNLRSEGK